MESRSVSSPTRRTKTATLQKAEAELLIGAVSFLHRVLSARLYDCARLGG